jgi:hypothetical protein
MVYFLYCTNGINFSNRYHKRVNDRYYKCFFSSVRSVKATCKAKLTPNIQNGGARRPSQCVEAGPEPFKNEPNISLDLNQSEERGRIPSDKACTHEPAACGAHPCMHALCVARSCADCGRFVSSNGGEPSERFHACPSAGPRVRIVRVPTPA